MSAIGIPNEDSVNMTHTHIAKDKDLLSKSIDEIGIVISSNLDMNHIENLLINH